MTSDGEGGEVENRAALDVLLRGDEFAGRLGAEVASLHALVHRTSRWHLGEDAWSDEWRATH